MSVLQSTPGPWVPVLIGPHRAIPPGERPIAEVVTADGGPRSRIARVASKEETREASNANAHLIAAAPELYGALDHAAHVLGEWLATENLKREDFPEAFAAFDTARAALAKARGER